MNKRRVFEERGGDIRSLVTEGRKARIESVLSHRTNQLIPVFEHPHDIGNVAAALRTAEGLGFQEAHLIASAVGMKMSPRRSAGAHKWMDVQRWRDSQSAYGALRERGYQIAVTCFDNAVALEEFDFSRPTAVVFGSEKYGVSEETLRGADVRLCIPMLGFSSSFNLSVAAALVLYEFRRRISPPSLSGDAIEKLRDRYYWLSSSLSR